MSRRIRSCSVQHLLFIFFVAAGLYSARAQSQTSALTHQPTPAYVNPLKLQLSDDTRQTEFGKQIGPVAANYPTYDHQAVGQAAPTTWLRIVRKANGNAGEVYTAYSSTDGEYWIKGGTWQHALGNGAQIGISAENAAGATIDFDYVHVYSLRTQRNRFPHHTSTPTSTTSP